MFLSKNMLLLCSFAVTLIFIAATNDGEPNKVKWAILKNCTVKVNGSSNVNRFSCSIPDYPDPDTLTCYKNGINEMPVTLSGSMVLPVLNFDCQNRMMTSDLRKTLKAREFPKLIISFLSLGKYPELKANQENIIGTVNIELAGVSKKISIYYKISMDDQKIVHLTGSQTIRFSDFNIVPPRKFGGMIRTNDQLDVTFHINFRVVPTTG